MEYCYLMLKYYNIHNITMYSEYKTYSEQDIFEGKLVTNKQFYNRT